MKQKARPARHDEPIVPKTPAIGRVSKAPIVQAEEEEVREEEGYRTFAACSGRKDESKRERLWPKEV